LTTKLKKSAETQNTETDKQLLAYNQTTQKNINCLGPSHLTKQEKYHTVKRGQTACLLFNFGVIKSIQQMIPTVRLHLQQLTTAMV